MVVRLVGLAVSVLPFFACGGEFDDLTNTFGSTLILAGVQHATTSNPDGTPINFWTEDSEGAVATGVGLSNPHMAAADAYGNIYIADKASHSVLRITADGTIHTFAGTHVAGFNGDGPAPATELQIYSPNGLFVFPSGVVYLLDPGNHRIRRVDTNGVMTTIVNDPEPNWYPSGRGLWVSPDEQLIYYTHEFAPVPPSIIADGAALKQWTSTNGIETLCSKAVGFRNPANMAVNPADGMLYICDRAEDDTSRLAAGLFRIDSPEQRTRITGNISQPAAADGQLASQSYIVEPRGIAFRPDGSYFICGHKDGNVWFVDTDGILHKYLRGSGRRDGFSLTDGLYPPLTDYEYFAQPRAVTLAPNGNLMVVCNDSGYVFRVESIVQPSMPLDFHLIYRGSNGVTFSWTGVAGRGYRIERSATLDAGSWEPIGAAGSSLPGVVSFHDSTSAVSGNRFYRLGSSF